MPELDRPEEAGRPDLRMPALGVAAWAAALLGHGLLVRGAPGLIWALVPPLVVGGWLLRRAGRPTVLGIVLTFAAVLVVTLLRGMQMQESPVGELAAERAVVRVVGTVAADPRPTSGRYGEQVLVRLQIRQLSGRGQQHRLKAPVLVIADAAWLEVPLGSTVRTSGRLSPAKGADLAGVLGVRGPPEVIEEADLWWRGAAAVRASVRASVAHRPADQRVLVPSLVDGDDVGLDPGLAEDFAATGLTHLLAVSGTNLTLVVGFLLVIARWVGVRGRGRYLVGAAGIVGFVLLARTEPSVVRAAAMGTVGLVGLSSNGRQRGLRALGVAVVCLLLIGPGWALTPGFALSVLATAGILVLAPGWRDALARWLPRWLAEAIAVPTAAQLACTPLVAAFSGQVSVVAVLANLLVAPVVGPATVLGLGGGLLGLIWIAGAQLLGTGAGWCVWWIVAVAQWGADRPSASVDWQTGFWSITVLSAGSIVLAACGPLLLRRRLTGIGCCLLLLFVGVVRLPQSPATDWILLACDVGQGDALVLRTGPGAAVVVDTGPDPASMRACLDRLRIERVPLLVLTHFHADHIDGLDGALAGRQVDEIETSPLAAPFEGAERVHRSAAEHGVPVVVTQPGRTRTFGEVTLQVLGPSRLPAAGAGEQANDASVVILAESDGVRILLTGDLEPAGQARLSRALPPLEVDVLKMPHHGSRHQDLDFLTGLKPALVLVSVGADNTYGHPAAEAIEPFERAGAEVLRTDRDGDLMVLNEDGRLGWRSGR